MRTCAFAQERLSDWISELQEGSENVEDLVSELEVAYNSVEVNLLARICVCGYGPLNNMFMKPPRNSVCKQRLRCRLRTRR